MTFLTPELHLRIASHLLRRRDLLALALTCKALHPAAAQSLYSAPALASPARFERLCTTLAAAPRLAGLVKRLEFTPRGQAGGLALGAEFWMTVSEALAAVGALECLVLTDTGGGNSWVLVDPRIRFRLREARLRMRWDADLSRFLSNQPELRELQLYEPPLGLSPAFDPALSLPPDALPLLRFLEAAFLPGAHVLPGAKHLVHVQLYLPPGDELDPKRVAGLLERLGTPGKTLRSVNISHLSEQGGVRAAGVVARVCPGVRHLGVLKLPLYNRHILQSPLIHLPHLTSLELDLSHWAPSPPPYALRALAAEVRTFCRGVAGVVFWIGGGAGAGGTGGTGTGTSRVRWWFEEGEGEWRWRVEGGR